MAALAGIGAFLAANAGTIGTVATVAGTTLGAMGTLAAGKQAQQVANFEADQLDAKGKEEQAAARVEADQYRRKKELALSSLTSKAAASGFTATDPTTLQLGDEIEEYGTLQEQMAMYGGTSRREGLEGQARGRRWEGEVAKRSAKPKAMATILGGISTLAGRYAPASGSTESSSPYRFGRPATGSTYDPTWRRTSTAYG